MAAETAVQLQGELQMEVMRALWRLGRAASVEEVRSELPQRQRGAYTTVQTVLNRLSERELLLRERQGKSIFYAAQISEADYYLRSLQETLAPASESARRSALARLVGGMDPGELTEVEALAREVGARWEGGKRR